LSLDHDSISVYGLGYVGLTICAAFLKAGYDVLGVDLLEERVKALNNGLVTKAENEIKEEIIKGL